jgi:hypothetical protein
LASVTRARARLVRGEDGVGRDALQAGLLGEQRDLVRNLERAAPRGEQLGERQDLLLRLEAAQHALHLSMVGDADLYPVRLLEVPDEAGGDLPRLEPRLLPQLLGALLQVGKVVGVLLDEVVDLLGGQLGAVDADHSLLPLDDPRGERLG